MINSYTYQRFNKHFRVFTVCKFGPKKKKKKDFSFGIIQYIYERTP